MSYDVNIFHVFILLPKRVAGEEKRCTEVSVESGVTWSRTRHTITQVTKEKSGLNPLSSSLLAYSLPLDLTGRIVFINSTFVAKKDKSARITLGQNGEG